MLSGLLVVMAASACSVKDASLLGPSMLIGSGPIKSSVTVVLVLESETSADIEIELDRFMAVSELTELFKQVLIVT